MDRDRRLSQLGFGLADESMQGGKENVHLTVFQSLTYETSFVMNDVYIYDMRQHDKRWLHVTYYQSGHDIDPEAAGICLCHDVSRTGRAGGNAMLKNLAA